MEELHQWMLTTYGGKEETTKAKEKEKAATKEARAKASTGVKDTTKDSTKAAKETTTKEDTTRAKEKATQDPNQAKATKAKETTANQKEKEATTTQHAIDVASPATGHRLHWAQDCRVPEWHIGEGEELHPLEQEQTSRSRQQ